MRSIGAPRSRRKLGRCPTVAGQGNEFSVCDRTTPLAKIVPFSQPEGPWAEEMTLVAAGKLRLPEASDAGRPPGSAGVAVEV